MTVRRARPADASRLAELHATRVDEGFLSTLGPAFLRRLYGRIVVSPDAFAFVADECDEHDPGEGDARIVGFAAAATDVGRLYRSFVVRDGAAAGIVAAPRLVRSWRRVLETLRYPGATGELPAAEILAVAVDERATGRGVGRLVVAAAVDELARRGVAAAKVVAAADNAAALRLYEGCGFAPRARIALHAGTASEVLVWSSS